MKNSFVLYTKYENLLQELSDEDAGKLFKAIMHYENSGEELELQGAVRMAFVAIRQDLDENREKWKDTKRKRSKAGKAGMQSRWTEDEQEEVITNDNKKDFVITEDNKNNKSDFVIEEITNITDNVNVNVNVSTKVDNIYTPVIEHLNKTCGTRYRANTEKTKRLIKARINEGYTFEDFCTVIDKKASAWMGTEFEKYLRPETLFGTKFESYLNEKVNSKNPFLNLLSERKNE